MNISYTRIELNPPTEMRCVATSARNVHGSDMTSPINMGREAHNCKRVGTMTFPRKRITQSITSMPLANANRYSLHFTCLLPWALLVKSVHQRTVGIPQNTALTSLLMSLGKITKLSANGSSIELRQDSLEVFAKCEFRFFEDTDGDLLA